MVIDPTIVYSTLLGGGLGANYSKGIALDTSGNILIAGATYASDFPTSNAVQSQFTGNSQGFVSKINPAGTALVYSTYLSGSADQGLSCIAVDSSGSAWVTGYTSSRNFPMVNAAQSTLSGYPAIQRQGRRHFLIRQPIAAQQQKHAVNH